MPHRAIVILAVCVLLVACGRDSSGPTADGTPDRVRIQLNWVPEPEFGGIYEAERAGVFKKHNLDVEILKGGPDVPAVQMVASGKVEFGIAAADEVIALREKGGYLVALFATYQTSPQGIMAHPNDPAQSIEDLWRSERTLAVQPGLAYVKYFRQRWGEPKAQLVPYQGGIAQFLSDPRAAQQCFVTAEPVAAKRAGVEPKVFLIADTGFNPYTAVVVSSEETLAAKPDVAERFIAAVQEGWRLYLSDPGPANRIMAQSNPSMDAAAMDGAAAIQEPLIQTEFTTAHGLGAMSRQRWQELSQQLVALGVIKKQADVDACFRNPPSPQQPE